MKEFEKKQFSDLDRKVRTLVAENRLLTKKLDLAVDRLKSTAAGYYLQNVGGSTTDRLQYSCAYTLAELAKML